MIVHIVITRKGKKIRLGENYRQKDFN